MKCAFFVALLLSLPGAAWAANSDKPDTITIEVKPGTGGGKTSQTWEMSPQDMAKFQAWVASAYGGCPEPPSKPSPDGKACESMSSDEAMAAWANATLQGTADNVERYVKLKAASDAVADVPPVEPNLAGAKKGKK